MQLTKRDIAILDDSGAEITLTIWGGQAEVCCCCLSEPKRTSCDLICLGTVRVLASFFD
jgi:hypothetical protein